MSDVDRWGYRGMHDDDGFPSTSEAVRKAFDVELPEPAALSIDRTWITLRRAVCHVACAEGHRIGPELFDAEPAFPNSKPDESGPFDLFFIDRLMALAADTTAPEPVRAARKALSRLIAECGDGRVQAALVRRDWAIEEIPSERWRHDPGAQVPGPHEPRRAGQRTSKVYLRLGLVRASVALESEPPSRALRDDGLPIVVTRREVNDLVRHLAYLRAKEPSASNDLRTRSTSEVVRETYAEQVGSVALGPAPPSIDESWVELRRGVIQVVEASGGSVDGGNLGPRFPRANDDPHVHHIGLEEIHRLAKDEHAPDPLLAARGALSRLVVELGDGRLRAVTVGRDWSRRPMLPALWRVDPGVPFDDDGVTAYEGHNPGRVLLSRGIDRATTLAPLGAENSLDHNAAALSDFGCPVLIEREGLCELLDLPPQSEAKPQSEPPTDEEIDAKIEQHRGRLRPLRLAVLTAIVRWAARAARKQVPDPIVWPAVDQIFVNELGGQVEKTVSADGHRLSVGRHGCDRKGLDVRGSIRPKANAILESLFLDR